LSVWSDTCYGRLTRHAMRNQEMNNTQTVVDGTCISYGNAEKAGAKNSEWITGSFYPENIGLRYAPVEIKWSHRPEGWRRGWSGQADGTSLTMVVSGSMRLFFDGAAQDDVLLSRPGDYVMWCPGATHDCVAVTDCTVITVRWRVDLRGES